MNEYIFTALLLALPTLIIDTDTNHRGLLIGIMISLLYWSSAYALLASVPLFVSFYIFSVSKGPLRITAISDLLISQADSNSYRNKPASNIFNVFLGSMALLVAILPVVCRSDVYVSSGSTYFFLPSGIAVFGSFAGPVFFGRLCDKKGPYAASVYLTLLAEISVCFIALGQREPRVYIVGVILASFTIGGFFTTLPIITLAIEGRNRFFRKYFLRISALYGIWAIAKYIYSKDDFSSDSTGDILLFLLTLTILSVLLLYFAWKKRITLVK